MTGHGDTKRPLKDRYGEIASKEGARAQCSYVVPDPIGYSKSIGYSEQQIESVPEGAVMGLGCGNPTAMAELEEGQTVLDLGCGGGFDAFLAAQKVGKNGKVIGVDMTAQMIEKAKDSARKGNYDNVRFEPAEIENLPIEADSIDVVISNCVINHSRDKLAVFREIRRVLKPNGRILISDLVTRGRFSNDLLQRLDRLWTDWLSQAVGKRQYLGAIRKAGLRHVAIVAETAFTMPQMDEGLKGKLVSIQVEAYK